MLAFNTRICVYMYTYYVCCHFGSRPMETDILSSHPRLPSSCAVPMNCLVLLCRCWCCVVSLGADGSRLVRGGKSEKEAAGHRQRLLGPKTFLGQKDTLRLAPLVSPVKSMVASAELHVAHDCITGSRHHFARHATLAAKPFLGDREFRSALEVHQRGDRAKHRITRLLRAATPLQAKVLSLWTLGKIVTMVPGTTSPKTLSPLILGQKLLQLYRSGLCRLFPPRLVVALGARLRTPSADMDDSSSDTSGGAEIGGGQSCSDFTFRDPGHPSRCLVRRTSCLRGLCLLGPGRSSATRRHGWGHRHPLW
jgi:hypothetical protein